MAEKIRGYAFRELSGRKKQHILNISLIAFIVALLITLNSLGMAYKDASRLPFEKIQSSIIVQKNGNVPENTSGAVTSCSLAPIRNDVVGKIGEMDGVTGVSYGLSLWVFDQDHFKRVLGVNWNDSMGAKIKANLVEGILPQSGDEVLVDETYARQYGLGVGRKTDVSGRKFRISGISRDSGNDIVASDIFMDLGSAQDLAYDSVNLQDTETFEKDDINIIFVDAEQTKIDAVARRLKSLLNSGNLDYGKTPTGNEIGTYNIYTPSSFEDDISSLFELSDRMVLLISLVVVVGSALIIIRSMSHVLLQRKKEFGIMKAVGFTDSDIRNVMTKVILFQSAAGYVIGLIVSLVAIWLLSMTRVSISIPWELDPYPHFLASNPSLVNAVQSYLLPIRFQPIYAVISFIVVMVIGLLTSFAVTHQINRLKVMEALKR